MPKTYTQTVVVNFPTSPLTFYSMEPQPINNKLYAKAFLDSFDGSKTDWFDIGIRKVYLDGTEKFWYYKPTLQKVINAPGENGTYTQFCKDGSVIQKRGQNTYYWSGAAVDVPEPVGKWSKCFCCYQHDGDSD
jgi:hypothetical protein